MLKVIIRFVVLMTTLSIVGIVDAQIPEEARSVALKEKANLSKRLSDGPDLGIFRGKVDKSEMDRATLGEGFIRKWRIEYEDVLNMEPTNLLDVASKYCYFFPLFVDGRLIGTIDVGESTNNPGTYEVQSKTGPAPIFAHISNLQNEYPSKDGYFIFLLTVHGGHYVVIQKDTKAILISPAEVIAARCLGLYPDSAGDYPLIKIEEGVRRLRIAAQEYLQQQEIRGEMDHGE